MEDRSEDEVVCHDAGCGMMTGKQQSASVLGEGRLSGAGNWPMTKETTVGHKPLYSGCV